MAVYSDHVCLLRSKNEKVKTSKRYHGVVSGSPMPIFLSNELLIRELQPGR